MARSKSGSCGCFCASSDPKTYAQEICDALMKTDFEMLKKIAEVLLAAKENGNMIFTAGNGGSASTASHIINDLTKGCRLGHREGFRTTCLNDSNVLVTCLANDFCYEDVYEILLKTLGDPGDILIVYSGSGNSPNIVKACIQARKMGITVVGFGGRDGGQMANWCDYCLLAPTWSMEQLEDLHVVYFHSLVCTLKEMLRTTWDIEILEYPTPAQSQALYFFSEKDVRKIPGFDEFVTAVSEEEVNDCEESEDDFIVFCTRKEEVEEAKKAGAYVVGIACDPQVMNQVSERKRDMLVNAGADCIIPNFTNVKRLIKFLMKR
ncbi:MAG: SIS domain-containing protein [Thermoguttaceae bacterium]|nr:SIS domain-containing protein [Thermoguttaceae bacterium]